LLWTTPLGDLLRGRLSGRLDVPRIIHSAGFPDAVCEAVSQVVRRTRLTRLERADVARELVEHFRDGLDTGATAEELVKAFGDARQAARLIRRAKIRTRHPLSKVTTQAVRCVLILLALFLAAYTVQAVRIFSATPNIKRNVLAEMNATALSIPVEQRAWPIYRAAALATPRPPRGIELGEVRPGDEQWDAAAAYVNENADAVSRYGTAAALPRIGAVYSDQTDVELLLKSEPHRNRAEIESEVSQRKPEDNPMAFDIRLPQLFVLRDAARLLRVDAYVAAERRESERALDDIHAMLGTVEHAAQMPFLVSDLVSLSIFDVANDLVGHLLYKNAELFDDRQLVRLSHEIAGVRGGVLSINAGKERIVFEDLIQRIYSDDGRGDGILTGEGGRLLNDVTVSPGEDIAGGLAGSRLAAPVLGALLAGRAEMRARYDEIMSLNEAEARTPIWECEDSAAEAEMLRIRESRGEWIRYLPISVLMPSLWRASPMQWYSTQRRDTTLVALALELYRREHGDWPASLDALVPTFIPTIPRDQYDGGPLKYRITDGGPLVYSVGVDRKDDHGRVDAGSKGRRRAWQWVSPDKARAARNDPHWGSPTRGDEIADGDWVLWPPAK